MENDITTLAGRAALREMAAKATAGPWLNCGPDKFHEDDSWMHVVSAPGLSILAEIPCEFPESESHTAGHPLCRQAIANAAFVAVSRSALPAAIDEIDRLTAELADADLLLGTGWPEAVARAGGVAAGSEAGALSIQCAQLSGDALVLTADNERLRAYLLRLLDARDSPPSDEPNTDYLSARLDQIEDVLRGKS